MTLGPMSARLLIVKAGLFAGLQKRLTAVGQMAFSNYIAHSVIYGFVFYGYGFNQFDKMQRYQLYYVVLGMWVFSLVASPMWLAHYRFGPLEWCWRSLTFWTRQPMRLVVETAPGGRGGSGGGGCGVIIAPALRAAYCGSRRCASRRIRG